MARDARVRFPEGLGLAPILWPGLVLILLILTAPNLIAQAGDLRFPFGLDGGVYGGKAAAAEKTGDPRALPSELRIPSAIEALRSSSPASGDFDSLLPTDTPPVDPVARKRFAAAAGELLLLEIGPWAFDRYVLNEDYAHISFDTIRKNLRTGFQYDNDDFSTNQSAHPYHGSLFFTAARSNGYGYWESGAFALTGSLLWECCMENTSPSINDLVNTTLGGMTRGEVSHRLSTMIRDNAATGPDRMWREIGASILDPVGALTRLLDGDSSRSFANPDDRFPSRVSVAGDFGYRRVHDGGVTPDQGIVSLSANYGDPFAGEIVHPFDTFSASMDLNSPGSPFVSRIEERGILKGWELTDPSDSVRHIVDLSQEYAYFNNASQVFGAQIFGAGALSLYPLGDRFQATTAVGAIVIPLAGVETTDLANPETGRNYDYGVGGGLRVGGRLLRDGREIASAGYLVAWTRTVNGASDGNTLQNFRGSVRVPIAGPIGIGGGYSWYSRKTTYPNFFEARKTQSEWRVFFDFAFSQRWGTTEP